MAEQKLQHPSILTDEARIYETVLIFKEQHSQVIDPQETAEIIGTSFSSGEWTAIQFNNGVMERLEIQRPAKVSTTNQPLIASGGLIFLMLKMPRLLK